MLIVDSSMFHIHHLLPPDLLSHLNKADKRVSFRFMV